MTINFQHLYWALTFQLKKQIDYQNQEYEIKSSNLFDEKFYREKNVADIPNDMSAIRHFLIKGVDEGRDPNPLFSIAYYQKNYPDVAKSKINPFIHFLRFGWREGRNPCALFDTNYYRHRYGKFIYEGDNPLLHYIRNADNSDPNPYFDTKSYLTKYPDVARSGVIPLCHYLLYGVKEGRSTSCYFDAKYYLANNPEVKDSGYDPLSHFLSIGLSQGRIPTAYDIFTVSPDRDKWQAINHGKVQEHRSATSPISIIMPIYRDTSTTKQCIDSVLNAENKSKYRLILINDCSPEPEMNEMLSAIRDERVEVIHNESNLGFVGTVNKGMSLYPDADVLLLNSDTLVANDWLDKIYNQAYSRDEVATVTPYSNNATICNFPNLRGFTEFPQGQNVTTYDQAFLLANEGKNIEIPTAVGFCMFIKRIALDEIGLFDVETFGKGYGEENDFCLKALKKGWKHILAADTFVYHAGEVSFAQNSSNSKKQATRILLERYPYYNALVAKHIENNEISYLSLAAISGIYKQNNKPTTLLITHSLGGGVETHIQDILENQQGERNFILLRPAEINKGAQDFKLEFPVINHSIQFVAGKEDAVDFATSLLRTFSLEKIHIHHTLQHQPPILELVANLEKPFDFTVHDYLTICPQITLTNFKGDYCGEPGEVGCNTCISESANELAKGMNIVQWRKKYEDFLLKAETVYCPSMDVLTRIKRYYPESNLKLKPHDKFYNIADHSKSRELQGHVIFPRLETNMPMKLMIIGALWPHKGSNFVIDLAKHLTEDISLSLMGYFRADQHEEARKYIKISGPYEKHEVAKIFKEINPHLIWLPSRCPETYSFTLTDAIKFNVPIVAPNIGAYQERLKGREYSWIYDWTISPTEFLNLLQKIKVELINKVELRVNQR